MESRSSPKAGRSAAIDTRAVALDRSRGGVGIGRAVERAARLLGVSLVAESEKSDVAAAEERFAALKKAFGPRVGLVHGRMSAAEKERGMEAFRAGKTVILVSTTVIEVGVDVPDATIMVIEHAERFGLAQLHQLRGRVGRGHARSAAAPYRAPLGDTARAACGHARTEDGSASPRGPDLRGEGASGSGSASGFRLALPENARRPPAVALARQVALARDPALREAAEAIRCSYLFGSREESASPPAAVLRLRQAVCGPARPLGGGMWRPTIRQRLSCRFLDAHVEATTSRAAIDINPRDVEYWHEHRHKIRFRGRPHSPWPAAMKRPARRLCADIAQATSEGPARRDSTVRKSAQPR